ncbi:hypothetical protein ABPG75_010716 [Micractinium tetrahymenae]
MPSRHRRAPSSPTGATIDDLPDQLLAQLFALVSPPMEVGPALAAVCKCWERALSSDPSLWRHAVIDWSLVPAPALHEACYAGKHSMLGRIAGWVATFEVTDAEAFDSRGGSTASRWRLEPFLRLLDPAATTAVQLGSLTSKQTTLQELQRLTGLTQLSLTSYCALPKNLGHTLRQLPGMRHLELFCWCPAKSHLGECGFRKLPRAVAEAVTALTALTELHLAGQKLPLARNLQVALPQLRELYLHDAEPQRIAGVVGNCQPDYKLGCSWGQCAAPSGSTHAATAWLKVKVAGGLQAPLRELLSALVPAGPR